MQQQQQYYPQQQQQPQNEQYVQQQYYQQQQQQMQQQQQLMQQHKAQQEQQRLKQQQPQQQQPPQQPLLQQQPQQQQAPAPQYVYDQVNKWSMEDVNRWNEGSQRNQQVEQQFLNPTQQQFQQQQQQQANYTMQGMIKSSGQQFNPLHSIDTRKVGTQQQQAPLTMDEVNRQAREQIAQSTQQLNIDPERLKQINTSAMTPLERSRFFTTHTLYYKPDCPWCNQLLRLLSRHPSFEQQFTLINLNDFNYDPKALYGIPLIVSNLNDRERYLGNNAVYWVMQQLQTHIESSVADESEFSSFNATGEIMGQNKFNVVSAGASANIFDERSAQVTTMRPEQNKPMQTTGAKLNQEQLASLMNQDAQDRNQILQNARTSTQSYYGMQVPPQQNK